MTARPATVPTPAKATKVDATAGAWATAFLIGIGAPVTANNIASVIGWGTAESGAPGHNQGHGGWSNFNPLNVVTQSGDGHSGQGGSQGDIADFPNLATGVAASVRLFTHNGNARPIIAALKADAPTSQVSSAANNFYSSWGGHISFGPGADASIGKGGGGANAGTAATTTGISVGDIAGGALDLIPGFAGVKTTLGFFTGILTNWRYIVEIIVGGLMVAFGVVIVMVDTGALSKASQVAAPVAMAAAA